jgi:nucleoside-diphosphate kinase
MQRTLAILKPDVHAQRDVVLQFVRSALAARGLTLAANKSVHLSLEDARAFYSEHRGRFFYPRLTNFMSSGPCEVLVIEGENAILQWRELIGPTHRDK